MSLSTQHKCHWKHKHKNLPTSNVYEENLYLCVEYYRSKRDDGFLSLIEQRRTSSFTSCRLLMSSFNITSLLFVWEPNNSTVAMS